MRFNGCPALLAATFLACCAHAAEITAVMDNTTYNAGSEVRLRLTPAASVKASVRYAGEEKPLVTDVPVSGADYLRLWTVPWDAPTGRYEVDLTTGGGRVVRNAGSFGVHRQLAKVVSVDLD